MSAIIKGKQIIIFSPQPWSYLYISKHHYARLLAENNTVYFITAPAFNKNSPGLWEMPEPGRNLEVLTFSVPFPERVKFYFPAFYKYIFRKRIGKIFKKRKIAPDITIDFGCYSEFDNLDFISSAQKIFFPVDDKGFLVGDTRGADLVVSVSRNIVDKYLNAGKKAYFINHGLSEEFSRIARSSLLDLSYTQGQPLRFGFAGNLFSTFMDFVVMEQVVSQHPDIIFELFGSMKHDRTNQQHVNWNRFMHESSNIRIRGLVSPAELAGEYEKMDGFLLCYKPDYINYHAENSHKILEYLSAGKILVSTYVSIYKDLNLICMSDKDRNEDLPAIFAEAVIHVKSWNETARMQARINYALDNTYIRQLERIQELLLKSNAIL